MRSLKAKIVLIILLCTVLSVTLVSVFSVHTSIKIVNENSARWLDSLCKSSRLEINTMLGSIEQSVNILAKYAQSSMRDYTSFKTKPAYVTAYTDSILDMTTTLVKNTQGAMSVYIRYNPEFTEPTSGLFLVLNNSTGLFQRTRPTDFSCYDPSDTEHVGWYYEPVQNGAPLWIAPYQNTNIATYMISYVVPLYRNNECFGVVGMDIDFELLRSMVHEISIYDSGYAFLLDAKEEIIVHPELPVYTPVSTLDGSGIRDAFSQGENSQYIYNGVEKRASMAQLNNGMILALTAPTSEIFRDATELTWRILLIALISFAVVALVAAFVITKLLRPATIDTLTGMNNRTAFLSRVKQRLSAGHGVPYAFIMLDLDHFKNINDTLGHAAGDDAIRQAAAYLSRVLPAEDLIGRFGGDEFLAFMQCGHRYAAERRLRQFQELLSTGGALFSGGLTCSIGIVFTDDYLRTTDQLMEHADKAMYEAKARGRNTYVFSEDSLDS